MSDVAQNETQEFWRPPVVQTEPATSSLAGACASCSSEFMVGARFCHVCGASRSPVASSSLQQGWMPSLEFLKVLEFQNIKEWLRLSTASLVAFLIGMGCLLAAVLVGAVYSVQSLADFQAIQLWRIEWLLAGVAAFVVAILLKRNEPEEK
jgi:MFS family permease